MTIVYKLTDQNMQTHGGCQWELGKTKETSGEGSLCGPGWLHYSHNPLLAVMLNPIHTNISNPRLFEAEADGARNDDHGLKGGCTRLTLLREIALPEVTTTQRVRFGILCAMQVSTDQQWRTWAEDWLSGKDRSRWAAAQTAEWAARAAVWATARDAEWAAAWAADAAALAAEWAATGWAAAREAARAVLDAAEAKPLDLIALARQAVEEEV